MHILCIRIFIHLSFILVVSSIGTCSSILSSFFFLLPLFVVSFFESGSVLSFCLFLIRFTSNFSYCFCVFGFWMFVFFFLVLFILFSLVSLVYGFYQMPNWVEQTIHKWNFVICLAAMREYISRHSHLTKYEDTILCSVSQCSREKLSRKIF